MTIRNREQAADAAEASHSYRAGACQLWTRTMFNADSVGDVDGDRDADAIDGWLSEPSSAKHYNDRNPPRGVPVTFSGGRRGFGHRAVSLGGGRVRSTDMSDNGLSYQPGNVGTTSIREIETSMGLDYIGWSETMSGVRIPMPPGAPQPPPKPKSNSVTKARDLLVKAEKWSRKNGKIKRANKIHEMLKVGPKD